MAAIMRHGAFKTGQLTSLKNLLSNSYATKAEKKKGLDRKVGPKIDSSAESLAAKGFLRPQDEYKPPADLEQRLTTIFVKVLGNDDKNTQIGDLNRRFRLFAECSEEFKHTIPSSLLYTIETLGDVANFYSTPVETLTPFDKMKTMELPKNLHVQFEYHRFHPETDTKFGGISAFPKSSTLVTGLKYRGKYAGYNANEWPKN